MRKAVFVFCLLKINLQQATASTQPNDRTPGGRCKVA